MTKAARTLEQIEKTAATFFISDLELAMTLTRIASNASEDSEKRIRNQANARHAYDDISRMSNTALLTDEERREVDNRLEELRSALQQLGEDLT